MAHIQATTRGHSSVYAAHTPTLDSCISSTAAVSLKCGTAVEQQSKAWKNLLQQCFLKLRICLARETESSLRSAILLLPVQPCGAVEGKTVVLCCACTVYHCWAAGLLAARSYSCCVRRFLSGASTRNGPNVGLHTFVELPCRSKT